MATGGRKFQDRITKLKKRLIRRIDKLIIRIEFDGLYLRGHKKKKWKFITWEQIAAAIVDPEEMPMVVAGDIAEGKQVLKLMTTPKNNNAKKKSKAS